MGKILVVAETGTIRDDKRMEIYKQGAMPQITKWGGKILGIGNIPGEGEPFATLMVQEWPSEERFREWQASEEYRPLAELRRAVADVRFALVPCT
jgi:uncharacterized protein (DUF1330 family)